MTERSDTPTPETEDAELAAAESKRQADPVRRTTYVVLVVLALLFVWYILADRHAPWTDQAWIQGFVVPITPKVSGKVIAVNVVQDQVVEAKQLLAQIDPREYELAVQRAEANLELAGQATGADTAAVRAADADLAEARAQLLRTRQDFDRIESIWQYAKGGTPLMTFASFSDVWVKAYLRENSIENLKVGDPVELALDSLPGRVFSGEISSIGFAVQQPSGGDVGELESVKGDSGWLRDAQRFPVIIDFSGDLPTGHRRMGGRSMSRSTPVIAPC